MAALAQGRIVYPPHFLPDLQNRNAKDNLPCLIVNPTEDIKSTVEVVVVCISGEYSEQDPNHVCLPWHRDKSRSKTKLTKPCAAVCNWLFRIPVGELPEANGFVTSECLNKVVLRISELQKSGELVVGKSPPLG
jgi:hypothetical protein